MVDLSIRAIEGCTSFVTYDILTMDYWSKLIDMAAEAGVNTLVMFMVPDAYYPETAPAKKKAMIEFEMGLDWPSECYPEYRNQNCPNADPEKEYLPELIKTVHSRGMRFYLRIITNKHRWLWPKHDEWRSWYVDNHKKKCKWMSACKDNPNFLKYYYRVLEELVKRYHTADGIILDQEKVWGPCHCDYTRASFQKMMGKDIGKASLVEFGEYLSRANAEHFRSTKERLHQIVPDMEVGVTVEALIPKWFDDGLTGLGIAWYNHSTTTADFIHWQRIAQPFEAALRILNGYCDFGPTWVMLDPTAADAGWDKNHWGWTPRTPQSIKGEVDFIRGVRDQLTHPENLVGISEFPISRLPLNHSNLQAVLKYLGGM